MIERIEPGGMFAFECGLPGETRADEVFPGHPNGVQMSRDRWLIVYATRAWRGVDDDRSIVYQLREAADGGPCGRLIKEGLVRRSIDDWDPLGDGTRLVRQLGHPVAFGVPDGACIQGRAAPAANVIAIKWRVSARWLNPETGVLEGVKSDPELKALTQSVEWMQCRLNDAGDDIEVLQPPRPLRQKGWEEGAAFCSARGVDWAREPLRMNQAFTQAVPFNEDCTEWVDCNHFDGRVAPLKYRFDAAAGLYEWVETGPFMQSDRMPLSEASIAPCGSNWILCARGESAIGWVRTSDPFARVPAPTFTSAPAVNAPVTFYRCADGVLRIFTGDVATSPYGTGRNPLYCWEIDPDAFGASTPIEIFDCIASGTLPEETVPRAEMCKLLPHGGGPRQWLLWRVRTKNVSHQYGSLPPVTPEWKAKHGLYSAALVYADAAPAAWEFGR